jgi:hypothetical protein
VLSGNSPEELTIKVLKALAEIDVNIDMVLRRGTGPCCTGKDAGSGERPKSRVEGLSAGIASERLMGAHPGLPGMHLAGNPPDMHRDCRE